MSAKLPQFETEEQVRAFWADHDSTQYFNELEELPEGVTMMLPKPTIVLHIDEVSLERLKRIAASRQVDYYTLVGSWLLERLQEEEKVSA
ncbi:MAG: hypothetical protein GXP41_11585 [Chloroflexi bacterium]|nr:hypothetical protein [Chloroflexota bacterium]